MLTPVSGSSSVSVTSSDKYAVFKQLSVDQPAEPTPPPSGTFNTSQRVHRMLGKLSAFCEIGKLWQKKDSHLFHTLKLLLVKYKYALQIFKPTW